ncbi:hypothetical protein LFAB_03565 [Lactiplantibacillus fabifermentans T30PCM01]|uniref:Uncharacterized protein n=1 Tax=Lactiplantibacillus fabifermentans T30PCM01 TaxID=1400520 RepID=W6T9I5_9LACO|nr:hypothetical protein LFAB_03565 [Lactiplantibacillus fabifermentans T30PCM01]
MIIIMGLSPILSIGLIVLTIRAMQKPSVLRYNLVIALGFLYIALILGFVLPGQGSSILDVLSATLTFYQFFSNRKSSNI